MKVLKLALIISNIAASSVFGNQTLNIKRWSWIIQVPFNPLGALINGFASLFGIRDKLDQHTLNDTIESTLRLNLNLDH